MVSFGPPHREDPGASKRRRECASFLSSFLSLPCARFLCDELHNTTSLLDLALGVLAEVARADDEGDFGQAALAEDFAVAEGEEVEDGRGVGFGALGEVLFALLEGDEGPEL